MKFTLAIAVLICALVAWAQEPPALEELIERAEQGYAGAQYNLGVMYMNGQGVPQDNVQAYVWISLAVSRAGNPNAWQLDALAQVAMAMTPEQIAEAQRLAREWRPKMWEELQAE